MTEGVSPLVSVASSVNADIVWHPPSSEDLAKALDVHYIRNGLAGVQGTPGRTRLLGRIAQRDYRKRLKKRLEDFERAEKKKDHNYAPIRPPSDMEVTSNPPHPLNEYFQSCNTLHISNLPSHASEEELKIIFAGQSGFKQLCWRSKREGPICVVEFDNFDSVTKALQHLQNHSLSNNIKGGTKIRYCMACQEQIGLGHVGNNECANSETSSTKSDTSDSAEFLSLDAHLKQNTVEELGFEEQERCQDQISDPQQARPCAATPTSEQNSDIRPLLTEAVVSNSPFPSRFSSRLSMLGLEADNTQFHFVPSEIHKKNKPDLGPPYMNLILRISSTLAIYFITLRVLLIYPKLADIASKASLVLSHLMLMLFIYMKLDFHSVESMDRSYKTDIGKEGCTGDKRLLYQLKTNIVIFLLFTMISLQVRARFTSGMLLEILDSLITISCIIISIQWLRSSTWTFFLKQIIRIKSFTSKACKFSGARYTPRNCDRMTEQRKQKIMTGFSA